MQALPDDFRAQSGTRTTARLTETHLEIQTVVRTIIPTINVEVEDEDDSDGPDEDGPRRVILVDTDSEDGNDANEHQGPGDAGAADDAGAPDHDDDGDDIHEDHENPNEEEDGYDSDNGDGLASLVSGLSSSNDPVPDSPPPLYTPTGIPMKKKYRPTPPDQLMMFSGPCFVMTCAQETGVYPFVYVISFSHFDFLDTNYCTYEIGIITLLVWLGWAIGPFGSTGAMLMKVDASIHRFSTPVSCLPNPFRIVPGPTIRSTGCPT